MTKTPMNLDDIQKREQVAAQELETGFECGFKLHYNGPYMLGGGGGGWGGGEAHNLRSAEDNEDIVQCKIDKGLQLDRVVGSVPFRPIFSEM